MFATQFPTSGSRSQTSLLARDHAIAISTTDSSRIVSRNFVTLCCALFFSFFFFPSPNKRPTAFPVRDGNRIHRSWTTVNRTGWFGSRHSTNGETIDIPARRWLRTGWTLVLLRFAGSGRINNWEGDYFAPFLLTLFTFNRESCLQFGDDPRLFNLLIKLAVEVAGGKRSARELIHEDNSEFPSVVNKRIGEMLWITICSVIPKPVFH